MPRPQFSILWHCAPLASSEYATLRQDGNLFRLRGVVVLPLEDVPCRIDYHLAINSRWVPLSASATLTTPKRVQEVRVVSDGAGCWTLGGEPAPMLDGCTDIDLGWTPATNTIPLRRLDLQVGERATISASWIRFPEFDVVKNDQTYERLRVDRWRYRSGAYDFQLVTDVASGLVLEYGEDLWRAVALTTD